MIHISGAKVHILYETDKLLTEKQLHGYDNKEL